MRSGSQGLSAPLARGSGEADSMVSLGRHFKAPSSKSIYDPAVLEPQVVPRVLQVFPNCGEQTLQTRCWSHDVWCCRQCPTRRPGETQVLLDPKRHGLSVLLPVVPFSFPELALFFSFFFFFECLETRTG